jgi:hypothetical protein
MWGPKTAGRRRGQARLFGPFKTQWKHVEVPTSLEDDAIRSEGSNDSIAISIVTLRKKWLDTE